jgi:hypothetical protein
MAITLDGTAGITTPDLTDTSLTATRVVYAGASGNLTGASTFVFDGSNLFVGGSSGTSRLAVANNTSDGTSNTRQYAVFGTTTTYLDSDASNLWGSGLGELQIQNGTATRPAMLSMGGSVNTDEGMGVINFFRSGNDDTYRSRVNIAGVVGSTGTAGRHGGYLSIRIAADGQTDPAEAFRFNPSGTVILKGGSSSATGTGITFPATQSASSDANTLDDYEEGTWTPATVNYTGSLTNVRASYIKIGRLVSIQLFCSTGNDTTSSGNFSLTGLPFSGTSTANSYSTFATFCFDNPNGTAISGGQVSPSGTSIRMLKKTSATSPTWSDWIGSDVNLGELNMTFTYESNA